MSVNGGTEYPGDVPAPRAENTRPFGRLWAPYRHSPAVVAPTFGRRVRAPVSHVSLQRERLGGFYAELWMIFSDPARLQNNTPITFDDATGASIRLGHDAVITLDAAGSFVFQRLEERRPVYTVTTSDSDRLMDFVVAHLARSGSMQHGDAVNVQASVGKSIQDVERLLILSTLRHCRGNRRRTAAMLGISLPVLRSKLYSYWANLVADARAAASDMPEQPGNSAGAPRDC
jgi:DNA-binding protein Fis